MIDAIIAASLRRGELLPETFPDTRDPVRPFYDALAASDPAVIAEVKYASPSGPTGATLPPGLLAREMAAGGAAALSVLTEPTVFGGDPSFIREVKRYTDLPVLRKDILVHPAQIAESRHIGADAVLLIAMVLGDDLPAFVNHSFACGLEPVIEIADEVELQAAVATGARIIGINNRDLRTLVIDPDRASRLGPLIRSYGRIPVAMSGIMAPDDLRRYRGRCGAFLIGTAISSAEDPKSATEAFVCM
ncbi:hypothetical protein RJ53_10270 [Methanocalculus chunghsingensis]|uniref:indole-3-glycerol-phosphate synthase n=1 Tax=Methanocalculus chunghsingensis TaxID=156457 RepID=A0A8J7WAV7_9EURY|nr:hypothetical protein [Methanocalculus chunghsingensis]